MKSESLLRFPSNNGYVKEQKYYPKCTLRISLSFMFVNVLRFQRMKCTLEFRSQESAYVLTRHLLNTVGPSDRTILRRGSAATRLLGLRVRNPPWAWISVLSVVWCQAEVSATD